MTKVVHIISGDLWGGSEAQLLMQLEELNIPNLEVLMFNKLETYKRYVAAGIKCKVIDENNGFLKLIKDIRQYLPSNSIIFTHGYKELVVATLIRKSKLVSVFHGLREPQSNFFINLKSHIYFFIYKFFARFFSDKIICVSDALKKSLGFTSAIVIRNCVKLTETEIKKAPNNPPVIFMAGRLVPIKRYDLALLAIKNTLNKFKIELHIAGDGIERQHLLELSELLQIQPQIKFLGFRNDIASLLNSSDIFLICSDSEGIPTILLEAMASGIKCIATNVGGIPEVVDSIGNDCCLLVEPGNSFAISNAIEGLLASASSVAVDKIRNSIETHYSPKRAASELTEIINQLSIKQ